MALECSGVNQHTSTFWSVTLQPVGADQATIWQMKGDIPSFHMRHRRLICTKRLQSYGGCINLNNFPLVVNDSSDPKQNVPQTLHIRKLLDMI